MDEIDDNLGRARGILRAMARRVMTNKLILAFIVLLLVFAIVLIAWLKWGSTTDLNDAGET
jgi:hypothetical protein